ncbi:MAG TPA: murein biosynthesis integral membrane protein MurJ [Gaiellaceae bacterium]|nr:murein biosynthesis integral membrane protein MurJ [Gaiellaceae bacterium]
MNDEERERERAARRLERDRRRREQGKPTYFESEAALESWPILQDPAEQPTMIVRARREDGRIAELDVRADEDEDGATRVRPPEPAPGESRRLARSGIVFSLATALSRVLGLLRESLARSYFGIHGPINAFEIAFLVPNTVRALVADAALSSAFVPVFSDLLEKGERRRAWRVASSLFWLMLLGLTGLTAVFVLISPWVMRGFGYGPDVYGGVAVGLSWVLFPIVVVLGLTGIVVGVLNSYDHFSVPALSPVLWNLVIVLGLVLGVPHVHGRNHELYVYAFAILVATIAQFLLPLPWLRGRDDRLRMVIDIRDPAVKRTFALMVPVTIGLGLININAFIDQIFATRLLDKNLAPAAIVSAFRLYMLPQGMFSVAVATVLFPALSRYASRADWTSFRDTVATGMRLILFLLVPAAAAAAVLSEPIVRLLYQHGEFTADQTPVVAHALAAFSLGLAFNGTMLMLNRAFFSLQSPWIPSWVALGNLGLNAALDGAFYRFGIWGIPLSTSLVNIVGTAALLVVFRRRMGRIGFGETARSFVLVAIAAVVLAAVSWWAWHLVDGALGRSIAAQVVSLGFGLAAGLAAYLGSCRLLGVRELEAVVRLRRRGV